MKKSPSGQSRRVSATHRQIISIFPNVKARNCRGHGVNDLANPTAERHLYDASHKFDGCLLGWPGQLLGGATNAAPHRKVEHFKQQSYPEARWRRPQAGLNETKKRHQKEHNEEFLQRKVEASLRDGHRMGITAARKSPPFVTEFWKPINSMIARYPRKVVFLLPQMKSQMSLAVPSSHSMVHKVSRTFAYKSFLQRRWQSWQYPTTFPRSRMSVNNVIYMRILPKKPAIKDEYDLESPAVPQI